MVMDNNNEWGSKISQACNDITKLKSKYEKMLNTVSKKLNSISIQQEILLNSFEKDPEYSHTTQLFSPYQNNENKRVNEKISEELNKISHQIHGFIKALDKIKSTKESYDNILACLKYAGSNLNKNTENNENNNLLVSKILDAQEFERQRIANDLHDVTIQSMTNLVHKTELCVRLIDMDHERAKIEMKALMDQTREIISSVRQIVYNLKPAIIKDLGLITTIQRYLIEYSKASQIQTSFDFNKEVDQLPESIKISLYRIIQEACNNIKKHSQANVCKIDLKYDDNHINLIIEDNGCGLEQNSKSNKDGYSGFGISIMKDRVSLLGGSFSIISHVSRGTKIIVCIPYSNKEEKVCSQLQ